MLVVAGPSDPLSPWSLRTSLKTEVFKLRHSMPNLKSSLPGSRWQATVVPGLACRLASVEILSGLGGHAWSDNDAKVDTTDDTVQEVPHAAFSCELRSALSVCDVFTRL
jgi:hypothetical protein